MNEEIISFLKDLPSPNERFNEYEFFVKGAVYLEDQINDYLKTQGYSSCSFYQGISKARAIPNKDTNKRFWHAVDTFRMVVMRTHTQKMHHKLQSESGCAS